MLFGDNSYDWKYRRMQCRFRLDQGIRARVFLLMRVRQRTVLKAHALGLLAVLALSANLAYGAVEVADTAEYVDSHGTYTIIGAVKNGEAHGIIPRVDLAVSGQADMISKVLAPIPPHSELPFKIRIPDAANASLQDARVSYLEADAKQGSLRVLYDDTLIVHDDGHLSGRVTNAGDIAVRDVSILAVVHGAGGRILDVSRTVAEIDLKPNQTVQFELHPDPAVSDSILYYSCFAVTDSFVKPVYTERNGDRFYFRYESGSWYSYPEFDEAGTILHMRTLNSFPLETYANFEFPVHSHSEEFAVYINGIEKDSIQSIDEWGNWHVAFIVEPRESGELLITGFGEGWEVGDRILIPDWMKRNAFKWSQNEADDETFLRGVDFMMTENIIERADSDGEQAVPEWLKSVAALWAEDEIDDRAFIVCIEYLVDENLIRT